MEDAVTHPGTGRRAVVITGAAAGIGAACAQWFAGRGWTVVGVDVTGSALPPALVGTSDGHVGVVGSVAQESTWDLVADVLGRAAADGGFQLRALVNNAAWQLEKRLLDTSVDELTRTFDVNVVGAFHGVRFAARHLPRDSAVVNLGSILGFTADPQLAAYSISKGAVLQLTRVAALELAGRGIRVNAVCPGAVRTPLTTRVWDLGGDPAAAQAQMESLYPAGRIAEPEEIADLVGFLASEGSRAMTGSTLVADGGLTATNAEFALTGSLT